MGQTSTTNFNTLEVVQSGIATVPVTSSPTNWSTIPHNLGYAPIPFCYLNGVNLGAIFSGGNLPLPTLITSSTDTLLSTAVSSGVARPITAFGAWMFAGSDTTNLYIITYNATGGVLSTFPVKYLLLRERAN